MTVKIRTSLPVIASLLVAILTIILILTSRQRQRSWGFSTLHNRYTFVAYHGRLWVNASPPAKWTTAEAEAWDEVKRLRNEDIRWTIQRAVWLDNRTEELLVEPEVKPGTPAWKLSKISGASDQPLLRGLDGPRKFIAASVVLSQRHDPNAVRVFSVAEAPSFSPAYDSPVILISLVHFDAEGRIEPPISEKDLIVNTAYLPTLRDEWHSKLDQTLFTLRMWWIFAFALILSLARMGWVLRERLTKREGLCLKCGYDLRASTGVCPECGAPIPKNASTPSTV